MQRPYRFIQIAGLLAVFVFNGVVIASGDTLYLRSGIQIHGIVQHKEGEHLVVRIGDRIVRIPSDSVLRIEENDNDGSFDREAAERAVENREQELLAETGLTREQRERLNMLIRRLDASDPATRGEARRELIQQVENPKVFAYIRNRLPAILPNYLPGIFEVLAAVNPLEAQEIIREYTTHPNYVVRGSAIELLGVIHDKGSLELILRGLLDHTYLVRMSACAALATIGVHEATPLLIDNLEHADLRVGNYAHQALMIIWEQDEQAAELKTPHEWREFWDLRRDSVPITVDLETLEPLVAEDADFDYC